MIKILFEYQQLLIDKKLEQEITFYEDGSYKFHEAPPLPTPAESEESLISEKFDMQTKTKRVESEGSELEESDENFEISNKPKLDMSQQSQPFMFFKRGRGRPPGSKNKTPEERRK